MLTSQKTTDISIKLLESLTDRYGNSFYILDPGLFRKNLKDLKEAFNEFYSKIKLGYSYKTNYIPRICQIAKEEGAFAEVVSALEYQLAEKIGYKGENIIFNGPLKEKEDLYLAFRNNSIIHFDSFEEIEIAEEYLSENPGGNIRCAVRCNFDIGEEKISRFGLDVANGDVKKAYTKLFSMPGCQPIGIHCHFSTRHRSLESYKRRAARLIQLAKELFEDKKIEYIDIGGGFFGEMPDSVKKLFDYEIPSFEDYGRAIGQLMKSHYPGEDVALILEPGASVVANTMRFVCRVHSIKYLQGRPVVTLTGGLHNVRPTGSSHNVPFRLKQVAPDPQGVENAIVGGYTCMENDIIQHTYSGNLSVGDFVIFDNMGAYNIVFKPPFIKETPPVICWDYTDDAFHQFEVIKHRETLNDIFQTYVF